MGSTAPFQFETTAIMKDFPAVLPLFCLLFAFEGISTSVLIPTTTTTSPGLESTTTTTTTTSPVCLAPGEICINFLDGSGGDCCSGIGSCNQYVEGVGFSCSSAGFESTTTTTKSPSFESTTTTTATSPVCIAPGEICINFLDGSGGDCCSGIGSCNQY